MGAIRVEMRYQLDWGPKSTIQLAIAQIYDNAELIECDMVILYLLVCDWVI